MSGPITSTNACISDTTNSKSVSVTSSGVLVAPATIDAGGTAPRRKKLLITNTGAYPIFLMVGSSAVAGSTFLGILMPATYSTGVPTAAAGYYLEDCAVEQDAIYAITYANTGTVQVYIGI